MEAERTTEEPVAKATPAEPTTHRSHTYEDDVSTAMNATDAITVQEMLSTARERETTEKLYRSGKVQRKWYSLFSFFFIILATAAFGYGIYHYYRLTVPVQEIASVGVFPSTPPIVASETTITDTVSAFAGDTTLPEGKPLLVPLIVDGESLTPISKNDFFTFIEAKPTEPFTYSMDSIRLGVMNDGSTTSPFIILSVPDAPLASKEFLIAEPTLLKLFYRTLGISDTIQLSQVGREFTSTYLYNMPVRLLSSTNPETGVEEPVLLYGYATEHIIVITTKPAILKAIYDTVIRQH